MGLSQGRMSTEMINGTYQLKGTTCGQVRSSEFRKEIVMQNALRAVGRFMRVFISGMAVIYAVSPPDKILSKETLIAAVAAGIVAISKFIRDTWNIDVKVV